MDVILLKIFFPNEEWGNKDLFSRRNKKSRQRWLFLKVQEIFDSHEIFEDFKHKKCLKKQDTQLNLIYSFQS
jgi:hypothetical protein